MTITANHADRILHNETLCASIRALAPRFTMGQIASELRRTAARRGIAMTHNEAAGLTDAILGDARAA